MYDRHGCVGSYGWYITDSSSIDGVYPYMHTGCLALVITTYMIHLVLVFMLAISSDDQ
jgi:hypothetical protein